MVKTNSRQIQMKLLSKTNHNGTKLTTTTVLYKILSNLSKHFIKPPTNLHYLWAEYLKTFNRHTNNNN